jgi:hypothetical protein
LFLKEPSEISKCFIKNIIIFNTSKKYLFVNRVVISVLINFFHFSDFGIANWALFHENSAREAILIMMTWFEIAIFIRISAISASSKLARSIA